MHPLRYKCIEIKRGDIVLCSPGGNKFGLVAFDNSCSENVKNDFNLAVALLHSFEYDEAEKVFAKIIDRTRMCYGLLGRCHE